jgi:DNA-binding NtrC family response regulator
VRELENAVESALALAQGGRLRTADFRLGRARFAAEPGPRDEEALPLSLEAYERSALERSLRESGGDVTQAARRLGIGRSTLYRKLAQHGIGPNRRAASASLGRARAIR